MKKRESNLSKIVWSLLKPKFLFLMIGVIVVIIAAPFVKNAFTTESKSTKFGFKDIGELATQSAYVTEVNVTEDARELFGLEIPFTQSKTIFSYDVVVKAGIDFSESELLRLIEVGASCFNHYCTGCDFSQRNVLHNVHYVLFVLLVGYA